MDWTPPASWTRLRTIDAHTGGEPLRVIVEGFPEPQGASMLERRAYARRHLDHLRRGLMLEPRGHADMYGCLPTAPASDDGHIGVLFMHNEGYSTMCGHGIIAIVTVGLECGLLDRGLFVVRIDTPAGRVTATPDWQNGRVASVSFENVPSFVLHAGLVTPVDGIGAVECDIAFGGAFYAVTDGARLGLDPGRPGELIDAGRRIKQAVSACCAPRHPAGDEDLNFLYGTIFTWPGRGAVHSRNVCVFADGEVDRSPTGTGVSARAAVEHARGALALGETIRIESIVGSHFDVSAIASTRVGDLHAIVPRVTGSAHITGRHEFLIDPSDPLADGFMLR